jgi:hypothetical protein
MEIGSEMNHSQRFPTDAHSFGATRFGIESAVPIPMVMVIQILATESQAKVKPAPLEMQTHSSMTHHSGTIQTMMDMVTTNPETWAMNVQENSAQVNLQFIGTKRLRHGMTLLGMAVETMTEMGTPTLEKPSPMTPHSTRIQMAMDMTETTPNLPAVTIRMETIQIYSLPMAHSVKTVMAMDSETIQVDPTVIGSQTTPRNGGIPMATDSEIIRMVL